MPALYAVSSRNAAQLRRLPFRCGILQVKADLIRQREVELLVPAAGPGASEVFHLLRPAALKSAARPEHPVEEGSETPSVLPVRENPEEQLAPAKQRRKLKSSVSFWSSKESMIAAAEAAFGPATTVSDEQGRQAASQTAPRTTETSAVAEQLAGLSCVICAHGEVISIAALHVSQERL